MESKTKLILTALGVAAIVVPAVLLIVFSGRSSTSGSETVPTTGTRQLKQETIQNEVNNAKPTPALVSPVPSPSPSPSELTAPTNPPLEATGAGGVN